jgi:magnesium transporter
MDNSRAVSVTTSPGIPSQRLLNMRTVSWGDLTWLDITDPTQESKKYLAEHYGFHPLDLDDCFSTRQLSKVDEYQTYVFALLHLPVYERAPRKGTTLQWSAFIGDNFLVTLHPSDLTAVSEAFHECEASEENRKEQLGRGSGYLMYLILDRLVDAYFPVLDDILSLMDEIEESVFDGEVEAAKEISILRQHILTQRRVMFPMHRLMVELETKLSRFAKTDISVYYGDLMDHMNKITETLDECRDTIEVFKDADYVLSGYRANSLIRTIAVMLAIGLPFLVAASLYLILPAGVNKGSAGTFAALAAAAVVIGGAILYFLRRRRLI